MNAIIAALIIASFVLVPLVSPCAYAAEFKTGVVDLNKVLNESDAGKCARIDLEGLIKSKQSQIDEKGKAAEKLKNDMEKQASILTPDARKAKEEELERLVRDYQRLVTDANAEVKKKENEVMGSILGELKELIAKVGRDEKYTLILEAVPAVVLYYDKALDITDRMTKAYNESKAKADKK
jgi:outer membrane protein